TSKSIFRMRRRLLAQAESWTGLATGKKEEERCMCQFLHSQWGRHMKAPSLPPAFIRSAQSEKRGCARSARLTRLKYELRSQAGLDCQSALEWDPLSAFKRDPFERRVLTVALAPSEVVGAAERARVWARWFSSTLLK